jgi:7,8-dihydropterin-6-yl-methyl-4-(beta-D-ribofuranosyl)aminobenzene 5'-phosphate synthase
MEKEMNRRKFIKTAAATGAVFLMKNGKGEGVIAPGVVEIPEAEKIVVTVITDNYFDQIRPDDRIAKRHRHPQSVLEGSLHAEHGLAYHVETTVEGRTHSFLFDFATDFQGVKRNMDRLKIDFRKVEALVLSHDHFDHQAALLELLDARKDELATGIPFYVGERFFVGTYWRTLDGHVIDLLALKREEIEKLGLVKIVEIKAPAPIVPGACSTGRIEQVTGYEKIPPVFVTKKGDQFVQEEFIGEQAIVMNAKGKGLVVLSGCAHRGIVNAVKRAQQMTGVEKVHAVIGGFHLTGAKPEVIRQTIADIKAICPDYIVPTHCTGFEAIAAFAREMPDQFILNTAGTRYIITE